MYFDSLTHCSPTGEWFKSSQLDASVTELEQEFHSAELRGTCVVGLPGASPTIDAEFVFAVCKSRQNWFPVPALDFDKYPEFGLTELLHRWKNSGAVGVKIHPRLSNISLLDGRISEVMDALSTVGLPAFICSYTHGPKRLPDGSTPALFERLAVMHPETKILIVHGGTTSILEMGDVVAAHRNLLLDLSFTIHRYSGSSLDQDIRHLCSRLDQRIVVGSDYPEYRPQNTAKRLDFILRDIPEEKRQRILYKTLQEFLGVELVSTPSEFSRVESDATAIRTLYTNRLQEFGICPQTLGWKEGSQQIRFKILTEEFDLTNRRILDIGCGFGDLLAFLKQNGWSGEYYGIDVVPEFIEIARSAHPEAKFETLDFADANFHAGQFDFVIASGVMSFRRKEQEHYPFIQSTIETINTISQEGFALDFLCSSSDRRVDRNWYADAGRISSIVSSLVRKYSIRHDGPPFEFSVIAHCRE